MSTPDPAGRAPFDDGSPTAGFGQPAPTSPAYPSAPPTYPAAAPAYPSPGYAQQNFGAPGYQPGHQQPYPSAVAGHPVAPRNGLGTAGLVCGIIGVVLAWNFFGVVLGILAVCFGGVGLGRAKRGEATNRGAALAGLILGVVALAALVILLVAGLAVFASSSR